jgi:hypothetical protein
MSEEGAFQIRCVESGASLVLSRPVGSSLPEYLASFAGPVVSAHVQVYEMELVTLVRYFQNLASSWSGWQESKIYESLERQLVLAATCDKLGHISLRVMLRENPGGANWIAGGTLQLEAGQLEALATTAEQVLAIEGRRTTMR